MENTKVITGTDVVIAAKKYVGLPYVFGAEAVPGKPVTALDCSELVELVCRELGVVPKMPDGSANQFLHCQKYGTHTLTMEEAEKIPGALLFRRDGKSLRIVHVAISTGQGNTVEARGKDYGVNVFKMRSSFTNCALIPGVQYNQANRGVDKVEQNATN